MVDLGWLVQAIPRLDRPTLVAVDGVDGSGKTTFAGHLACAVRDDGRPAHVVHMDDFLNPRAIRYARGRFSPQGYFLDTYDLATFTTGVLDPLQAGGTRRIVPRVFDHRADSPVHVATVLVPEQAVVICRRDVPPPPGTGSPVGHIDLRPGGVRGDGTADGRT